MSELGDQASRERTNIHPALSPPAGGAKAQPVSYGIVGSLLQLSSLSTYLQVLVPPSTAAASQRGGGAAHAGLPLNSNVYQLKRAKCRVSVRTTRLKR